MRRNSTSALTGYEIGAALRTFPDGVNSVDRVTLRLLRSGCSDMEVIDDPFRR